MTRSFSLCVLLSQMALALFLFGERRGEIAFAFGPFFAAHKLLAWYLVGINLAAFAAFAADKYRAVRRRRRIRNATLLTLAALGGSVGVCWRWSFSGIRSGKTAFPWACRCSC